MSSNGPAKASSVWPEMPFMRGPRGAERLREWLPQLREIREQTAARRARVLAHDWAKKELCLILGLKKAEQWNGYVAPHLAGEGHVNDSPKRVALIELLRKVAEREASEGE